MGAGVSEAITGGFWGGFASCFRLEAGIYHSRLVVSSLSWKGCQNVRHTPQALAGHHYSFCGMISYWEGNTYRVQRFSGSPRLMSFLWAICQHVNCDDETTWQGNIHQ